MSRPLHDVARRLQRGASTFLLVGAAGTIGACGDPAPGTPDHTRVDTLESGVVRVDNDLPARPDSLFDWSLVPETTFAVDGSGTGQGTDPPPLSYVADVTTDDAGRVYVLDGLAQTVFVFRPDGTLLRRVGDQGEGPGEFLGAIGLDVDDDGNLWVVDPRLRRYSVFQPDGALVTTHVRPIQGSSSPWAGEVSGGVVLDWGLAFPDERPDVIAGERVLFEPFRVHVASGQVDSFPPITFRQEMVADGSRPNPFFSGSLVVAVDAAAGNVWFADSRRYELTARTLAGDTTRLAALGVTPAPVTEADVEELRARFRDRPDAFLPYLESLPATKPVVESLSLDPAGHLYVAAEVEGRPASTGLDVFDRAGSYLGRLPFPEPVEPGPGLHVDGDDLYVVVTNELDIPRVQRLHVARSPG